MTNDIEGQKKAKITVVHEGRGGYVVLEGYRYPILLEEGGRFTIFFPHGNRPRNRQGHLQLLEAFCQAQNPPWAVENRSKKRKSSGH